MKATNLIKWGRTHFQGSLATLEKPACFHNSYACWFSLFLFVDTSFSLSHLKSGYTLLCEMWTRADPVVEGKTWKLRVISSDRDLPLCEGLEKEEEGEEEEGVAEEKKNEGEEVKNKEEGGEEEEGKVAEVAIGTEFYTKEVREYCLPDRDSVLFRYSLRARRTECPITAQLTTSKKDAYIKLEVRATYNVHRDLVVICNVKAM